MIKYRYPGEEPKEIDGDDYSFELSGAFCDSDNHFQIAYIEARSERESDGQLYTDSSGVDNGGHAAGGTQRSTFSSVSFTRKIITVTFTQSNGEFYERYIEVNSAYPDGIWVSASLRRIEHYYIFRNSDGSIRKTRKITPGSEWGCHEEGCLFKVFKEGEEIYRRTHLSCPEVGEVGEGCPEGTCEVECGDTICCYGSDGISVFNFPKP